MNILMITIGYPPRRVGGTEVYVFGLVEALQRLGHQCAIAYIEPFELEDGPDIRVEHRTHMSAAVSAIGVNTQHHKLEFVIFDMPLRKRLVAEFEKLVANIQPDIIHVHPLQLGFESYLIESLNRGGHKVVLTYHSTNTSCARGDLIFMGEKVCDGRLIQQRCAQCLYHWKSVPKPLAKALAKIPPRWYRSAFAALARYPLLKKLRSFTSIPIIIEERLKAWSRTMSNAKAVVAVCDWVKETIVKNGVPVNKVTLSRHGLRLFPEMISTNRRGIVRFGYLGRISPEKGIQLLVDALGEMPADLQYEFEFCSSSFDNSNRRPEEERLVRAIFELQKRDGRIRVLSPISDTRLAAVLAAWDALIVPSRWLESGPQVVYEAFAVKTPVIGSRLGGIAELVSDGETGFLFTPGKVAELAALLKRSIEDPATLRALRKNIQAIRTTAEVADEMLVIYNNLASASAIRSAMQSPGG